MLHHLITFSLRYRLVVVLLAAILLIGGGLALREAPWDVFPEFAPALIVVQTEAPGLSAEEVERLVTVPIEASLGGLGRLETLRSSSIPGLSVVTAIFEEGTDLLNARHSVSERLAEVAPRLPKGTEPPRMAPLTASTSRLLMVGLTSETVPATDLRRLAERMFRTRIQRVRGVAHVEIFGGEVKQYQVRVVPQRLQQFGLTLDEVVAAARKATGFGGAGFIETANQRLPIRQQARVEAASDLAATPVLVRDGAVVTLGQVADVVTGAADKAGDATINGRPGVLLIIHKQPDFNTLGVTDEVQKALGELEAALPQGVELHPLLFRQAAFIERAIGNLSTAILLGCVLVTLILIAFLFQWRTVVISLLAIPLSLLGAILILRAFGASLNTMTLGGLAIALGEVVDDAIVDVENVLRRLRENRQSGSPRSAFAVILDASLEVRSAVVYASFIVVLVFLPVFFLEGIGGRFFRPLGYAYITAILVSLAVAVTVTPALCLLLLPKDGAERGRESPLVHGLKAAYGRTLAGVLRWPRTTVAFAAVLFLAGVAAVPFLGGQFLPDFRESNFQVFMAGMPDSSLAESTRVGGRVADRLLAIPGVLSVAQQTGRADLSEDTWGPNISEVWIVLDDNADFDMMVDRVRESLGDLPGYAFQTKQFLRERIDEVLTGTTADIAIRVVGPDLDVLRQQAERIRESIAGVAGIVDLRIEQQVDIPQLEIVLRPRDVARYGLSVGDLHETIQTLLGGTQVGQVYEGDSVFDVTVRADPSLRTNPAALRELLVDLPNREKIPLRALADVRVVDAPNAINREGGSRRILVTFNVRGRDIAGVMNDVETRIRDKALPLPAGYHLEYGGEHQARKAAEQRLLLLGAAALAGIFILLYLDFKTIGLTLIVMLSVPLAWIGSVAAVLLAGSPVSLGSLVGLITLFGIVVRNGILMVSHYEHLRRQDGLPFGRELLLRGAAERLAPILMTASATALALVPLVVRGNLPGHEIEYPMAVVIVGGLVSSTLLTLFVLPVLYGWVAKGAASAQPTADSGQ